MPAKGVYGLASKEFPEPIFNRAMFTRPPINPHEMLGKISKAFIARSTTPSFFVQTSCGFARLRGALAEAGLRRLGRYFVLQEQESMSRADNGIEVHEASKSELKAWSRAYLKAFYGDEALLSEVHRSLLKANSVRGNRIILAERKGEVAGTMALHTIRGCTGLYCLGTVPEMRGSGVASRLLAEAHDITSKLETKLVLQVFESDGVEEFYLQRGYARAFAEEIFG